MKLRDETQWRRERSVRRRILRSLAVLLYRRPGVATVVLGILTVAAAWRASRIEVAANLRAFVPRPRLEQEAWDAMSMADRRHEPVLAVVHFPGVASSEKLKRDLLDPLSHALRDPRFIAAVEVPPIESLSKRVGLTYAELLVRMRPEDFDLLEQMTTPAGARQALKRAMETRKAQTGAEPLASLAPRDPFGVFDRVQRREYGVAMTPKPEDGARENRPASEEFALRLTPTQSSSEFFYCIALDRFLTETIRALKLRKDSIFKNVSVRFHGPHIRTARLARGLKIDLARSAIIVAVCLILLLILAFRKAEAMVFIALPPCVGFIWTFGLTSFFTERLTLLSAVFPTLLIALGIEYTVQIYYRFIEELYRSQRYYQALGTAYTEAGRGVFASTLTTAVIFFALYLSSFHDLKELALVGGLTLFSMAASALLVLPPLAAIKSRLARERVQPVEMFDFGLSPLSAGVIASPRAVLALGLLVTAYLAFHTREVRIDREIGLDLGVAVEKEERNGAGPESESFRPSKPLSILIKADSLQEALGRNDRLYANLLHLPPSLPIGTVRSLSPVVPSSALQRNVRLQLNRLDIEAIDRSLRDAATSAGKNADAFAPFVARLVGLQKSAPRIPLVDLSTTEERERIALAQRRIVHVGGTYQVLTTLYPSAESPGSLTTHFEAFRKHASERLDPAALLFDSEVLQNQRVSEAVVYSMALALLLSALLLLVCLAFHFRGRFVDALMALLPVVCAIVWTFGLLPILDVRIGLYALLVFPLVIGIAMNQSVVLIQRFHDRRYASLRQVLRWGGRPNILTALVLVIGCGCLVQVRFQALQEMAAVALVAVGVFTVATLGLVPAILQIRQEGGLRGWMAAGDD